MKKNILLSLSFFLFTLPASTNYKLNSFSFGAGGETTGSSSNYAGEFILGESSDMTLTGSNYNAMPGLIFTQQANTPPAPTVTNDANYYNKLNVVINIASNPSNTTYAIAVSDDNFVTTEYVQSDNTVGPILGSEDWQTYTNWGGATGEFVIGLEAGTTYYFKVKAERGDFTEGPWGPVASVATAESNLAFDIDVASTDTESAAPYVVGLGNLSVGSVTTASDKIWIDLTSNAEGGAQVFITGSSAGLYSAVAGYTISSVTGDLSALNEGFGIRYDTVDEGSGGPLTVSAPFDGSADNVGQVPSTYSVLFDTSSAPITNGRGSALIKAKIQELTPSANDYSETITLVAVGTF